jgi:hypothetical protein
MRADTVACDGPACWELTPSETGGDGGGGFEPAIEVAGVITPSTTALPVQTTSRAFIGSTPLARQRNDLIHRSCEARTSRSRSARLRDQVVGRFARSAEHAVDQRRWRSRSCRRGPALETQRGDGLRSNAPECPANASSLLPTAAMRALGRRSSAWPMPELGCATAQRPRVCDSRRARREPTVRALARSVVHWSSWMTSKDSNSRGAIRCRMP